MTTVGLVGCAATKLRRPAPARKLYTSQLFRKAAAYAEQHSDRWYVLSAKHGLVRPDTVLAPYDEKLGTKNAPVYPWAAMVVEQIYEELVDVEDPELLVLAGDQYRVFLREVPWPRHVPMLGMGIGEQLGYLTRELGYYAEGRTAVSR